MRKFEDLPIDDQNHILKEMAEKQGAVLDELRREVCAEAGLDPCHPWPSFPDRLGNVRIDWWHRLDSIGPFHWLDRV